MMWKEIERDFLKSIGRGASTTANESTGRKPLTLQGLKDAMRKLDALGPPPPIVQFSKHVPALGAVKPPCSPITDDMRQMCDDIGPQQVRIAWCIKSKFGDMVVINPLNAPTETKG